MTAPGQAAVPPSHLAPTASGTGRRPVQIVAGGSLALAAAIPPLASAGGVSPVAAVGAAALGIFAAVRPGRWASIAAHLSVLLLIALLLVSGDATAPLILMLAFLLAVTHRAQQLVELTGPRTRIARSVLTRTITSALTVGLLTALAATVAFIAPSIGPHPLLAGFGILLLSALPLLALANAPASPPRTRRFQGADDQGFVWQDSPITFR